MTRSVVANNLLVAKVSIKTMLVTCYAAHIVSLLTYAKQLSFNCCGNILSPTLSTTSIRKLILGKTNPFLLQWLTEILSFLSRLSPLIWLTVIENFSHSGFTVFLITSVLCRFRFPAQANIIFRFIACWPTHTYSTGQLTPEEFERVNELCNG